MQFACRSCLSRSIPNPLRNPETLIEPDEFKLQGKQYSLQCAGEEHGDQLFVYGLGTVGWRGKSFDDNVIGAMEGELPVNGEEGKEAEDIGNSDDGDMEDGPVHSWPSASPKMAY